MWISPWTRNMRGAHINKQCGSKRSPECAFREEGKDPGFCRDRWRESSHSPKWNQSHWWKLRAMTELPRSWEEDENGPSPHAAVWLGQQAQVDTAFQARPQLSQSLAWYWICNKPNLHVCGHSHRQRAESQAANRSFGSGLGAPNRPC